MVSKETGIVIIPESRRVVSGTTTGGSLSYDYDTPIIVSVAPGYSIKKDFFTVNVGLPLGITESRFVTGISGNFDFIIANYFTIGFDVNSFIVTGEESYNITTVGLALGATF